MKSIHFAVCRLILLVPLSCGALHVQTWSSTSRAGSSSPGELPTLAQTDAAPQTASETSSDKTPQASTVEVQATLERRVSQKVQELDFALHNRPDAPLANSEIAGLDELAAEAKRLGDVNQQSILKNAESFYAIENAWRKDESQAAAVVSKLLGTEVVTQGVATKRKDRQHIEFEVEDDQCYLLFAHLRSKSGSSDGLDRDGISFSEVGGDQGRLQRFWLAARRTPGPALAIVTNTTIVGVCATGTTKARASFVLDYVGQANAMPYAVLKTPRNRFPDSLTSSLAADPTDLCDPESWKSFWTRPIPGSIVYDEQQPYLVVFSDSGSLEAYSPSGIRQSPATRLSNQPPAHFKFDNFNHGLRCGGEPSVASSTLSRHTAQCYQNLNKRFDPQFDAARDAHDRASTYHAQYTADLKLQSLRASYDRELDAKCRPMEQKAVAAMATMYDELITFFTTSAPKGSRSFLDF